MSSYYNKQPHHYTTGGIICQPVTKNLPVSEHREIFYIGQYASETIFSVTETVMLPLQARISSIMALMSDVRVITMR